LSDSKKHAKKPAEKAPSVPPAEVVEGRPSQPKAKIPSDAPRAPLPLDRLVALLPGESESDSRWGARRHGDRIPFCKPIALQKTKEEGGKITEVEVEALFEGWALNVNKGGMRIITEQPLKEGDIISVEVTSSGVPYSGRARVCWVREQADGVIAGLRFEDKT
jgi:PilZ domain